MGTLLTLMAGYFILIGYIVLMGLLIKWFDLFGLCIALVFTYFIMPLYISGLL